MHHFPICDVVIAGAGPVGLLLACELRLGGVSVLVLERSTRPESPLKQLPFGMRGLSIPSVEALHRRGLLNELQQRDTATAQGHWAQQTRRPGGHFAGIQFFHDNIDSSTWRYHVAGPAGEGRATTMEDLEAVLRQRALDSGVEIRWGLGVERFEQSEDGVTILAGEHTFGARWLIGCDGGRSTVRKLGAFAFAGTEPEFTGYSVVVEFDEPDEPDALAPGRHYTPTGMYTFQKPGIVAMVDFDGGIFHRTPAITREHVESVLRKVSGAHVTVKALVQATTWTDRAFQATAYRNGRVLLAGDAAHIHSPLGGQGLNLGLGDAMNLGWKLAATIRGDAPRGLLETYQTERHPVGAQILDWSRAQVAVMRPTRSSRALEAVLRDLIDTRDGATYFAERVWGLALRYDWGDSHPLVGRSAPDVAFVDGSRLGDHLHDGRGLLVDLGAGSSLEASVEPWTGRVRYLSRRAAAELDSSALLLRPDGVVAWVCKTGQDVRSLVDAAARWFGEPKPGFDDA